MRYERAPEDRERAGTPESKGSKVFGLLLFLCFVSVMVLLTVLDRFWSDHTYRWAAEHWPGGAYAFAACVGVAGPCVAALAWYCTGTMDRKSWRQHKARTLTRAALAFVSTAALVPFVTLVYTAQDTGKWGRGPATSPSWVFRHYPWLWTVGLLASVVTLALLLYAFHRPTRDRRPTTDVR